MYEVKITQSDISYPVGKIVCLGRNYLDHIRELNNKVPDRAVIFCKPATSIIPSGGEVIIPDYSQNCHHELELALLIGKPGKDIAEAEARSYIAGYGVAIDLTLRDVQDELKGKGLPWEIAKGFDSSCPLSDFVPADQVSDANNIQLTMKVNGEIRQQGTTAQMMRSIEEIISEISKYFTLETGDIILTGTPAGVSKIVSGDQLDGEIEQVGRLQVSVA